MGGNCLSNMEQAWQHLKNLSDQFLHVLINKYLIIKKLSLKNLSVIAIKFEKIIKTFCVSFENLMSFGKNVKV